MVLSDDPLRAYIGPIYLLLAPAKADRGLFLDLLRLRSASTLPFGGLLKHRGCCGGQQPLQEALRADRTRSFPFTGPRLRRRPIDQHHSPRGIPTTLWSFY